MYSMNRQRQHLQGQVVEIEVSRALERSRRPCIRDLAVINPASGCLSGCLFCPVVLRRHNRGVIQLHANLIDLLRRELALRARQGRPPVGVLFNTSTDSFQPVEPLLDLTHQAMRLVLEEGCRVHFVTRGVVPESFGELFRRHSERIHAQVSMFSMDEALAARYEPFAPRPQERLESIRRLIAWGVEVRGRVEPLIPFLSDTVGHMEELLRHLRSAGVIRSTAAYLVLRPHMLEQFQQALPAAQYHLIKGSFKGQAWYKAGIHQTAKLLSERVRTQGYQRLVKIGKRLGMDVTACLCQNPSSDRARQSRNCFESPTGEQGRADEKKGQLDLFSPT